MKLVLAEKPSVAQSIAKVVGATKREDGYIEGNGYIVSWCVGHLVELAEPEAYDEKYSKYLDTLKGVAAYYGYEPSSIDELLDVGFSTDEIEELLYERMIY